MNPGGFRKGVYWLFAAAFFGALVLCVSAGSVGVPLSEVFSAIFGKILGKEAAGTAAEAIVLYSRLPQVLMAALVGASLALCGGAMQGMLRNPLADGSTLGVSSGASLGAVLAIALGIAIPGIPLGGTMVMAMLFGFLSLAVILTVSYKLDLSLSTNTIILVGVVFSMFASSLISLVISFAGEKAKTITFWTMGSLSGHSYTDVLILLGALLVCGPVLLSCCKELDAFAMGEENARHVGVDVRRVKLKVMAAASVLIGVCVAMGGTIAFVGLVVPHFVRRLTGPSHLRLLPASMVAGGVFLMLADLISRVIVSPAVLPVGVVTSLVGAAAFMVIFFKTRRAR